MINLKYLPYYYGIMFGEGKSRINLLMQEERLLTEIETITSKELASKIKYEFKSTHHDYDFMNYLEILERCKRLLLKGIDNFDTIRKIIYKNLDCN